MVLMGISVLKAIWRDSHRQKQGVAATAAEVEAASSPAE
jgi:hypothetical protein